MIIDKDNEENMLSGEEDANYALAINEALEALMALGYSEKEAEMALKKVNKEDSVEDIIKNCLKVLMG